MRVSSLRAIPGILLCAVVVTALAPGCSDTTTTPEPIQTTEDENPPPRIGDLRLEYPILGGAATLTWTAPGDGAQSDTVAAYDIRYSYSFPMDWALSARVEDPPHPARAGTQQSYALVDPTRGRDLYAAIRSVDAAGNQSPVSSIAHVRILGHTLAASCVVATTGAPVAGLDVVVTSRLVYPHTTDAAGYFSQDDLTAGAANVAIRYGSSGTLFHSINHAFDLEDDVDLVYNMIPFEKPNSTTFDSIFQLFRAAAGLEGSRVVLKKWRSIPVDIYIPDFVNGDGVDYGATTRTAVATWEQDTGIDLFRIVDAPPQIGIVVAFKTRADMGGQLGITYHTNDPDGYPIGDEVDLIDEFSSVASLYGNVMHEIGHTIRLQHLPAGFLMTQGLPRPTEPTEDEVRVVQLYTALPNGLNISIYDDSNPAPTSNP